VDVSRQVASSLSTAASQIYLESKRTGSMTMLLIDMITMSNLS
jgi:hypothetical protein